MGRLGGRKFMGESALPRTERQNPAGSRSPRRGFALGGREKEGPSSRLGLGTHETSRGRTLDAPILSHGTNQARRGSRERRLGLIVVAVGGRAATLRQPCPSPRR